MNIFISKQKAINMIILVITYILLIINYNLISGQFGYLGFLSDGFSNYKLFLIFIYTLIWLVISIFIKDTYYKLLYTLLLILLYFGQSIFYVYNDSPFILVFYMSLPSAFIFILDKLDTKKILKRKGFDINDKYTRILLIVLIFLAILPFFKYISSLNVKNLFLMDIYETRSKRNEMDSGILGYLISPLSRVLLPFLMIYAIIYKKIILFIFSITSILLLFLLNGAVKSIFIGIFCAIFFYRGNYVLKEKYFIYVFFIYNIFALLSYFSFGSIMLNDYLRRIVFVPSQLFNVYYEYFYDNFTYYTHTKIYSIFTGTERGMAISKLIAEYMGEPDSNANTGVFVEGFYSLGTLGVIFATVFFGLFVFFVKKMNFDHRFFGLFFVYIYIFNTSFIETLLFSHALLFLIVFSILFIPSNSEKKNIT